MLRLDHVESIPRKLFGEVVLALNQGRLGEQLPQLQAVLLRLAHLERLRPLRLRFVQVAGRKLDFTELAALNPDAVVYQSLHGSLDLLLFRPDLLLVLGRHGVYVDLGSAVGRRRLLVVLLVLGCDGGLDPRAHARKLLGAGDLISQLNRLIEGCASDVAFIDE